MKDGKLKGGKISVDHTKTQKKECKEPKVRNGPTKKIHKEHPK
eukprot:CAMPEP_0170554798 /NCGR_PEP_ID=MMETSP0211-20121228/12670_1 /TAXON_ID=311385 /ORGANISM="Pseudokeronopsis sp., Strain OXSARD2" /LENGTH=42 /DNA_ID= /DNA_START= /DNA_END= /DNA_ORIENTATION=